MKILVYENRKCDPEYWDISTPEKRTAAYLAVFQYLDDAWQVYSDLEEIETLGTAICEPCQKKIHRLCERADCVCVDSEECSRRTKQRGYDLRDAIQQKALYDAAKNGNATAAYRLVRSRGSDSSEYENVQEREVNDPLAPD